uniref:RNA cytidine acetyltransferase n=1 Tax=Panagrellus redivivus TaxID=6233 RepID=A0A7E4UYI6_PANRE
MVRVKVDNRIRTLVDNGVALGHRSMFVVVGNKARDQVVTLHQMLTKAVIGARPNVLWCYKKELGFSSHKKKRNRETKKKLATGIINSREDDPFEMFVSSTEIRYCYYKESHKILGNTYGVLVLQDFEAITPNLLARTIETVEGGGLVILLLQDVSSLRQLFTMTMDVHSRYRTEAHTDIVPRFNERFILSLSSCKKCIVMDDHLNVLPISSHINSIEPVPPKTKHEITPQQQKLNDLQQAMADSKPIGQLLRQCKTACQGEALLRLLDVVTEKTLRATCSITAARGRGKSAALGLAIAGAIGFGYSNIFITSPSPENLKTLFEFIVKGFDCMELQEHADYELIQSTNPDFNKALVRINVFKDHRQTIQYIHPTDAAKLGQAELVVIDEAAAIPLPLVKELISGPYLVFLASTINGYEGTGRSLSLKLLQQLRTQAATSSDPTKSRTLHELTLEESIRYKPGDDVESWLCRVLCLDATNEHRMLSGAPSPKDCELYYVNRDTLFSFHKASESFLTNLMSIYVSAHYKNTPNDLQLLSDAPAHHVFVLLGPVTDANKKVPDILAIVQVCLEGGLARSTISSSLDQGRRGAGDLLPWTVSQQFLESNFGTLSGGRIVRIAVHPDFQSMGYGSRALQLVQQYYQGLFPCISEGGLAKGKKQEKIRSVSTASVALVEEQIAPRENLPPLLIRLEERPAEQLDYLGVSFGLTLDLLKFWKKAGFAPVYLRQTTNDLTGEHTAMMLKVLNDEDEGVITGGGSWMADFYTEFRQRLISLLSFQFRSFSPHLALSLMHLRHNPGLSSMLAKIKRKPWTPEQLRLVLSPRDQRRLSSYVRNLVDHHLVTDIVPTVAGLYFTEKLHEDVTLNLIQSAILVGVGLQRKTVDEVAADLGLPINQVLALFLKAIRVISEHLDNLFLDEMEGDLEKTRKGLPTFSANGKEANGEKLRSLDDDLKEAEDRIKQQQKKDKEALVGELKLDQYAIKGTEAEWTSAVSGINLTSSKGSGIISVKSDKKDLKRPPPKLNDPAEKKIKKKKLTKYLGK